MKGWKLFALLLPALLLCACGQKEPARENSPPETTVPVEERVPLWSDLRWDGRLELDYAEGYTVDFSPEGYARISIDQETYLLVPEDGQVPAELPEDVTVLRQPLDNIYLQATSAMVLSLIHI